MRGLERGIFYRSALLLPEFGVFDDKDGVFSGQPD
jgi:hypothetical protein